MILLERKLFIPVLTNEYLKCRPKLPPVWYHYCSVNTFLSIMENYNIWLSDAEKTNGYTEMKWLFDKIKEVIDEILSSYEDIFDHELLHRTKGIISEVLEKLLLKKAPVVKNAKSFMFCLSEANDLLSQWRAYGNDGKGVAIGFNTEVLSEFMSNPFYTLTKVIYSQEDTFKFLHIALDEQLKWSIESSIDSSNNGYNESKLVVNIFMLIYGIWEEGFVYKNNMFVEEQEWRIFRKIHSDNYSNDNGVDDSNFISKSSTLHLGPIIISLMIFFFLFSNPSSKYTRKSSSVLRNFKALRVKSPRYLSLHIKKHLENPYTHWRKTGIWKMRFQILFI